LPGALQKEEEKQGNENGEKNDDPDFHGNILNELSGNYDRGAAF
jgi:hypothetical protein